MPRPLDPLCALSAATSVLGDRWSWLVVQEVARGHLRFDALVRELGISRKVLSERLSSLVADGVLRTEPYSSAPPRHEYLLTPQGRALLPLLVGLQDWGDRWVLGDGEVTATSSGGADEARVHALVGRRVPALRLPSTAGERDVVDGPTVLFAYPATGTPSPLPEGWGDVPGAAGCTLENRLFRARHDAFLAAGLAVRGVSTQRPEEQAQFAAAEDLPFPLLSDADLQLTSALRLPVVRVADTVRLRRVVLRLDGDRTVRAVRYPVDDLEAAVEWALSA